MQVAVGERDIDSSAQREWLVVPLSGHRHVSSFEQQFAAAIAAAPFDPWRSLLAVAQPKGTGGVLYGLVVKRCLDVALAALAIGLLIPLLLVVALAVRLDSAGPAIFRQTRIGRGGKSFVVFKFRTMSDSEQGLRFFQGPDGTLRHKLVNDPRVTRIGRFLRRTSIDELPQLINVLRGEMSLIGPRPELPGIVEHYQPWQHQRHLVRPGMTGWWQVQGRSDRPMHENTELDLYYVENLSPGLDVQIIRRTIRVVLSGLGAF